MNNSTSGCLEGAIHMGCLPRKPSLPTARASFQDSTETITPHKRARVDQTLVAHRLQLLGALSVRIG
jgi:hypothetical protein